MMFRTVGKKFALLPKRIGKNIVWLKHYYVFSYIDSFTMREVKHLCETFEEALYFMEQ